MSTTLKFRRGTTAELGALTGSEAEIFVDTTKKTLVLMDGSTLGGVPIARSSEVPVAVSDLTNDLGFLTAGDIPTAVSDLTNDLGFVVAADVPTAVSDLTNDLSFVPLTDLADVATSGLYTDLLGVPNNLLDSNDIGVTVQGYNANLNVWANNTPPTGAIVGTTDYQVLTNKTFTNISETVYTLPTNGTIALNPQNGSIQTCALDAMSEFTLLSFSSGQSIILMLTGGSSYTVTWPTLTWVTASGNSAPTLTAADTIVIWKIDSIVYAAVVGSYE